jgi:uncharacterized membrane protein
MGNAAARWASPLMIVVAIAASLLAWDRLPEEVTLSLQAMLPFNLEQSGETAPRWFATLLLPLAAGVVWAGFQFGRTERVLRRIADLFPDGSASLGDPASIERSGTTYDTIVAGVIVLMLGFHAGLLSTALGHEILGARLASLSLGVSMLVMGNVFPRLRPNVIAGVRTARALANPSVWRSTHRFLGYAFVVSGLATIIIALVAPAYGLLTAIVTLLLSTLSSGIVARVTPGESVNGVA